MWRRFILILLFLGVLGVSEGLAQHIDLGLSFDGGFPQGSFKQNVDQNGIGLEGMVAVRGAQSPVSVGLNLGFFTYGTQTRKEIFNPNIPEVRVGVRTSNNIFTGHLFTRLEPVKTGAIRPYADALVGLHYLWTESSVEDDDHIETIASSTNFEDTAFSYGGAVGLKIKVATSYDNLGNDSTWYIDLKARYLQGGQAEYLKEGALRNVNGQLEYDTSYSSTDLVTVGVGFAVTF